MRRGSAATSSRLRREAAATTAADTCSASAAGMSRASTPQLRCADRKTRCGGRQLLQRYGRCVRIAAHQESDLDRSRGAVLVRRGKGGKRREVGMDRTSRSRRRGCQAAVRAASAAARSCDRDGARGRRCDSASTRARVGQASPADPTPQHPGLANSSGHAVVLSRVLLPDSSVTSRSRHSASCWSISRPLGVES